LDFIILIYVFKLFTLLYYWAICFSIICPASFSLADLPNYWSKLSIYYFCFSFCSKVFSCHSFSFFFSCKSSSTSPISFFDEIASLLSFWILALMWFFYPSFSEMMLFILLYSVKGLLEEFFEASSFKLVSSSPNLWLLFLNSLFLNYIVSFPFSSSISFCAKLFCLAVNSKILNFSFKWVNKPYLSL